VSKWTFLFDSFLNLNVLACSVQRAHITDRLICIDSVFEMGSGNVSDESQVYLFWRISCWIILRLHFTEISLVAFENKDSPSVQVHWTVTFQVSFSHSQQIYALQYCTYQRQERNLNQNNKNPQSNKCPV